jgi:hypothetical protein
MISKEAVERYLQANDVAPTAPDEEIKEILLRAKWHASDVETALTVLRENPTTKESHTETLHRVFHSDDRLQPETISALLGIDIDTSEIEERQKQRNTVAASSILTVFAVAIGLSATFVGVAMWILQMGPFYRG